eukprot:4322015-Amphidinium_carterae.1
MTSPFYVQLAKNAIAAAPHDECHADELSDTRAQSRFSELILTPLRPPALVSAFLESWHCYAFLCLLVYLLFGRSPYVVIPHMCKLSLHSHLHGRLAQSLQSESSDTISAFASKMAKHMHHRASDTNRLAFQRACQGRNSRGIVLERKQMGCMNMNLNTVGSIWGAPRKQNGSAFSKSEAHENCTRCRLDFDHCGSNFMFLL